MFTNLARPGPRAGSIADSAGLGFAALLAVVAGCTHPFVPVQARCERGTYLESAALCEELSRDAADADDRARYALLAARDRMWTCASLEASTCVEALDVLWRESTDPAEVEGVLALSEAACAAGVSSGCARARDAFWAGRGVPVDVSASVGWQRQCKSCGPWTGGDQRGPGWPQLDPAQRLARARALVELGGVARGSTLIAGELEAGLLTGVEAEARMVLDGLIARRWTAEVEPLIATEPLRALAAAEPLIALAPTAATLLARRAQIRATLAAPAVERMAQAAAAHRPLTTWFHAARAAQLGASVTIATVDRDALWSHLETRAQVSIPTSCDWLRAPLASTPAAGHGALAVTANLACEVAARTWTVDEPYTWNEEVEVERTEHVAETSSTTNGSYVSCTGYGMKPGDACGYVQSTTTTTPGYDTTYMTKETVSHEATRAVEHRQLTVAVTGSLTSAAGTAAVGFRRVVEDTAYTSEHGSKSYGPTDLASLQLEATAAVRAGVDGMVASVIAAEAAAELQRASLARDPLAAEEHLLRAVTLGDPGDALRDRYQLTTTVASLLAGAALVLPDPPQPTDLLVAVPVPAPTGGGYPLAHYPAQPTIDGAAEDAERARPGRLRTLVARTALVWDRSDRTATSTAGAGDRVTTMLGARLERGWRLPAGDDGGLRLGWQPGFTLGGGGDGELGGYAEARAGIGAGVAGNGWEFLGLGGGGYSGLGVRDLAGGSAFTSAPTLFWGAALRFGLDAGLSLDGSLLAVRGGPLGAETGYTAQLLYRRPSAAELGIELSFRAFPDQHETISGFGVLIRAPALAHR